MVIGCTFHAAWQKRITSAPHSSRCSSAFRATVEYSKSYSARESFFKGNMSCAKCSEDRIENFLV